MHYVWYIVCKRPVPQEARYQPFVGVVRVDMKTGKATPVPPEQGSMMLLPRRKDTFLTNGKPFLYWRECHSSWEDEVRLATAYRAKTDAEEEALLLVAKKPHLIGHVRVRRGRATIVFGVGGERGDERKDESTG